MVRVRSKDGIEYDTITKVRIRKRCVDEELLGKKKPKFQRFSPFRETLAVEQAGAKIVYIDTCDQSEHLFPPLFTIEIIEHLEEEKEIETGVPQLRLIFVLQDRDYWPWSEEISSVMVRRAAKAKAYDGKGYPPDHKVIYAPRWGNDKPKLGRFFEEVDPALPGTKFIIDNLGEEECASLEDELKRKKEKRS